MFLAERGPYCAPCKAAYQKEWRAKNSDYQRMWYSQNQEEMREYHRKYHHADPARRERKNRKHQEWYQKNREHCLQYAKDNIERSRQLKLARHNERYASDPEYAAACRVHANVSRSKRRYARDSALAKQFREEIKAIYAACPKGYHVDHIHPLKGENFSGLEVPWNLQYLPAAENIRKGNRMLEMAKPTAGKSSLAAATV
jgi:hypothetical protein